MAVILGERPLPALAQAPRPISNLVRQVIYVNPLSGSDRTGNGTTSAPFRTIGRALNASGTRTGVVIQLAKGIYSANSGETFPLYLRPGVILRGNEINKGIGIIITGGGDRNSPTHGSQNIAILSADRSELRGVTVMNANLNGYGLWLESTSPVVANNTFAGSNRDGVFVTGTSTASILENVFVANRVSGISVEGVARPEIRGNQFRNIGFGISVRQNAAPQISENLISGNQTGLLVQSSARPILRANIIEKNQQHGLLILANSFPDLGNQFDPGRNIIRDNIQQDAQNLGEIPVMAMGNQISPAKISGRFITATVLQPEGSRRGVTERYAPFLETSQTVNPAYPQPLRNISSAPMLAPFIGANANFTIAQPPSSEHLEIVPIPNSAIARISPTVNLPIPSDMTIHPNLPPVLSRPPEGEPVNRPIIISRPAIAKANTATAALRYRVVVPVLSETSVLEIRRIVPYAFPSRQSGRLVVQVGAYSDRASANIQVKNLTQAGFRAIIETIDP